jgi:hypothetical protein
MVNREGIARVTSDYYELRYLLPSWPVVPE